MPERSTATATILITVVVASTELRIRLGDNAADQLFAEHLRSLGEVVDARGGRIVKATGDGVMAAFDSASAAVAASVGLQQWVAATSPELSMRVGLASGDVAWEDGDCFGLPVVTAARLEQAAEGGQILVSGSVRLLAGDRAGDRYHPRGPMELKGIPHPVDVFAVAWEPRPEPERATASPPPLAPILAVPAAHDFVARAAELDALHRAWEDARRGGGRVVLVGGEAGAGKTRLATEFASRAHLDGASALFGGCDSDLALPYQPWVQAIEQVIDALPRSLVTGDLAPHLARLAQLLPRLERLVPGEPRPEVTDPSLERQRLYAAFSAILAQTASTWATVVVLDDLHWAGTQTLALLRHLVRAGLPERLLLIATFRDTGDEITEPLAGCLADLRRTERADRLRLGGFDRVAVERFLEVVTGQRLDDDLRRLADTVADRTAGNAFYVGELWQHLVNSGAVSLASGGWVVREGDAASAVPEGVREVVAARLARLSPSAQRLTELAVIAGHRVDLRVLALALDQPIADLDRDVTELVGAGLLTEAGSAVPTYQFTHALVHDTVERAVSTVSRAQLHLQVATALEAVHEADRRPVLAELARHFVAAAPYGTLAKAVHYGRRAAAQAMRSAAYDEAVAHLESLLAILPRESRERAEALVELGSAHIRRGRYQVSRDVSAEAFRIAVQLADGELAAQAALGFEQATQMPGLPGGPAVALLESARALAGDLPEPLVARLDASHGRALALAGHTAEGIETAQRAVAKARAVGDPETLVVALQALVIAMDDPVLNLEHDAELSALADRMGDQWGAAYASTNRFRALVVLGRLDEARLTLEQHAAASTAGRFPAFLFMAHAFEALLSTAAGDFATAEAAAERAQSLGAADDAPFDAGVYGLQMFAIRRAQGRLGEVAPVLRALASTRDAPPVWKPGLGAIYVELGQLDEACTVFDSLAPDAFAAVPRDAVWPACLMFLAEMCVALEDVDQAVPLYEELLAFAGRNLVVAMTMAFGPADRLLGSLAALLGRPRHADEHFGVALELAERSGSPVWAAEVQHDWAIVLASRGELERARAVGREAYELATRVGLGRITSRPLPGSEPGMASRTTSPTAKPEFPDGLSGREVEVLRLVAAGRSNREIGESLFISPNTVANHVRAILQKTRCANRAEAASYAARNNLLV